MNDRKSLYSASPEAERDRIVQGLRRWWRRRDIGEQYIAAATDLAELERRMRVLERASRGPVFVTFKVAFLLRELAQPWETVVLVDYMNGLTRQETWRERSNAMGEVPVLEDGARRLSQSGAILTYLANKHGAYAGSTP